MELDQVIYHVVVLSNHRGVLLFMCYPWIKNIPN